MRFWPLVTLSVLTAGSALGHGFHPTQAQALARDGVPAVVWSGAEHMLTGYDHLLFLFGVMLFLTSAWQIFAFVTAFTVAHSVTLIGATLLGVRVNYYLVDAFIALSVIYIGFANLQGFRRYFDMPAPNLLLMVVGFGLVHGLGLSTRFQSLRLPQEGRLSRLIEFNVGIELGQIAALVVMIAVLAIWRRSQTFTKVTVILNTALVLFGALLFLMQTHAYLHNAFPDEFGFSSVNHMVDHFNNDIPSGDALVSPDTRAPTDVTPPDK